MVDGEEKFTRVSKVYDAQGNYIGDEEITIIVGGSISCPRCGAEEVEDNTLPVEQWKWNIRPNKVHDGKKWWSQCLRCKAAGHADEGWF